jgi:hypothetical protein
VESQVLKVNEGRGRSVSYSIDTSLVLVKPGS